MVVDSSALVAILQMEPQARVLLELLATASRRSISSATLVETATVMRARHRGMGEQQLDELIARYKIEVVALDAAQAEIARDAFRRFGKGQHPAGLNYGDLFSYALAKSRMEPLLFVGNDFSRTDIIAADRSS